MPEAGRAIIQDQMAIEGIELPLRDREAFAALILVWQIRSNRDALRVPGPAIFDRGIPDVISYLRLCGLPVPASM
jgi:predicted ATPase